MPTLDWYFDFISPFSYLQLEHFHRLPAGVTVRCKPVLLGVLLDRAGSVGPAEIPAKRRFTYRHVLWQARRHGLPLRFPPAHPFNPLKALRLALALDSREDAVRAIFRFIWRDGRSIDDPDAWAGLVAGLRAGPAAARIDSPEVKERLRANTDEAAALGVFGVPSFVAEGEIFWGFDATDMLLDYLRDPALFRDPEMVRVSELPVGLQRRRN